MRPPIKQNSLGLLPDIQRVGCFFRCALRMAEQELGRTLTEFEINLEWIEARNNGYIDDQLNLKNAAKVATICLRRHGGTGAFIEIATETDGSVYWYTWVKDRTVNYRIMKIRQGGPSRTHFVEVDENKNVTFDPHEPAIRSLGEIYTVYYRYDGGKE